MSAIAYNKDWLVRRGDWPVSIPVSKAEKALNELVDLLGRDWVTEKVNKYLIWRNGNSLETAQFVFHREPDCNPLTPYLAVALDFLSGRFTRQEAPEKYKALLEVGNLAGSVFYFEDFWKAIPSNMGKNHIVSTLRNANLCRGMLAELNVALHFIQCGAESVVPCFIDPRASKDKTDVLVKWRGKEIEIHCKSKIPGAGYLVPFDIFDYWAGCFLRDTEFFRRNWYVKFELSGEMNLSKAKSLRQRFQQWLSSRLVFERASMDEGVIATSQEIFIPSQGLSTNSVTKLSQKPLYRAFSAKEKRKDGNYHALSVIDVVANSAPRPVRSLSNSFREIKKHLSGDRPAIAIVHIFDSWDLTQLMVPQARGFRYWLNSVLKDENGRKICALTLSCEEGRQPLTGLVGVTKKPLLMIINPNAPLSIPESLFQAYQESKGTDN